ncbi:uncharacterized protein BDW70DRAFT_139099 [Aspergillus foveolatus]|uniref:uncharacterized protein n=1 Tax=Aspergillus foveolatus TaxID=210207 RepID=UPI003CCDAE44
MYNFLSIIITIIICSTHQPSGKPHFTAGQMGLGTLRSHGWISPYQFGLQTVLRHGCIRSRPPPYTGAVQSG